MYNMKEKYAKLKAGGANPYIDPAGYKTELDIDEAMFHAVLEQQKTSSSSAAPPAASPAGAPSAAGGTNDALVAQGKARFKAYMCFDCHGDNGEGTADAPDLIHTRLNADQISKFLQKPSVDATNKGMPDFAADSPDLKPLVAYVLSLKQP